MLWVFWTAWLAGLVCGCLVRAPALILLSFLCFVAAFVSSLWAGMAAGSAFITAILVTAALQIGYLVGAGLRYIGQRLRRRLAARAGTGRNFDEPLRRSDRQPIPHR
jgi:hypothetical protein